MTRSLPEHFALPATARWFNTLQATCQVDFSRPTIFSYFFCYGSDTDVDGLRERLESAGFRFIKTDVDSEGRMRLEVEKKEIHSPESLVERNRQFSSLAAEFLSAQYDGYEITLYSRQA